jgi:hypothetical protein
MYIYPYTEKRLRYIAYIHTYVPTSMPDLEQSLKHIASALQLQLQAATTATEEAETERKIYTHTTQPH